MKELDFDNLFTYMSLIFAICIFITIFYGCVFANAMGGKAGSGSSAFGTSQILENFLSDDKSDVKTQLLTHLKDFKDKSATSSEDKKQIEDIIEKINSNSVSVADLDSLIKLLKESSSSSASSSSSSASSKDTKDTKDSSKESSKDSSKKDTSKDSFTNEDSKKGTETETAKPVKAVKK